MKPKRIEPGPGQESAWDYPRPPRVEPSGRRVRVIFNGEVVAETTRAYRILETSHPPVFAIPPDDLRPDLIAPSGRSSACEWKGRARYHHLVVGDRRSEDAAWSYPDPVRSFRAIRDYLCVYPGRVDSCLVDDEPVIPQEGAFYGGWITSDVVGPFKGGPGSWGW